MENSETKSGEWGVESGEWRVGSGEWGVGSGELMKRRGRGLLISGPRMLRCYNSMIRMEILLLESSCIPIYLFIYLFT